MLLDQGVELFETGLRSQLGRVDRGAHHAEQPAHLVEGGPGRVANRGEPVGSQLGQAGGGEASTLGLNRDRRDVMGDDVVQLSGDPGALGEERLFTQRRRVCGDARIALLDHACHGCAAAIPKPTAATATMNRRKLRASGSSPLNGDTALKRNGRARHDENATWRWNPAAHSTRARATTHDDEPGVVAV